MMSIFFVPLLVVVMLSLPVAGIIKKYKTGKQAKTAIILNLCSFFAVMALAVVLPVGGLVSAETTQAAAGALSSAGIGYLAAALSTGIGSIGAGIAVASAASAAIGATAEEPKSFSKSLIFVALGEGVALYGFLISFMILNKL